MVLQRNWYFADVVSSVLFTLFDRRGKFLDFGGGHGIFTRLMRDKGFDFCWDDPHGRNIFARGFEYGAEDDPIELITCIECFEHFIHPRKELEKMLGISSNIFLATQLLPSPVPRPDAWDYYGLTHGQHISFYSAKTLHYLADQYNLHFYTNGINMHLFTKKSFHPLQFKRAIHPGALQRLRIKMIMKSKIHSDYKYIVQTKNDRLAINGTSAPHDTAYRSS
jgi:2-polyprenyl-3-methyl-5-hydroxy-6-metoxy-1,4-benzoquinol methylase